MTSITTFPTGATRTEQDSLGSLEITAPMRAAQHRDAFVIVTALTPYIGYGPAARLAKQALLTSARIADLVVEEGLLDRARVDALLQPALLSGRNSPTAA